MNNVAQRLKEWVNSRFSSDAEFAKALNKSRPFVSQLLNGVRNPGNKLQAELRALGADVEYIMTGKKSGADEVEKVRQSIREELRAELKAEFEALKNEIRESTRTPQDTTGRSNETGGDALLEVLRRHGVNDPGALERLLCRFEADEKMFPDHINITHTQRFTSGTKLKEKDEKKRDVKK